MYLHMKENSTEYINNLIDQDRIKQGDPKYIDSKIQDLLQQIKNLKDLKKQRSQINLENLISEFYHDPDRPEVKDELSRNMCFKFFKKKYWSKLKQKPEYRTKNPADVFNEVVVDIV